MKPNKHSGAATGDSTGVPTGLNRKARRAIHAARDKWPESKEPQKAQARTYLDTWTEQKLDYQRVIDIVDDMYEQMEGTLD